MRDVPLYGFRQFRQRAKIILSGPNLSQDEVGSGLEPVDPRITLLADDNLSGDGDVIS